MKPEDIFKAGKRFNTTYGVVWEMVGLIDGDNVILVSVTAKENGTALPRCREYSKIEVMDMLNDGEFVLMTDATSWKDLPNDCARR